MLPCQGCAYRESIPGDAHIRCKFAWTGEALLPLLESSRITARTAQWFLFPFNYDPVWGPSECPSRSETLDSAKVAKPKPIAELLASLR